MPSLVDDFEHVKCFWSLQAPPVIWDLQLDGGRVTFTAPCLGANASCCVSVVFTDGVQSYPHSPVWVSGKGFDFGQDFNMQFVDSACLREIVVQVTQHHNCLVTHHSHTRCRAGSKRHQQAHQGFPRNVGAG
jgi:hypothetical protein